MHKIKSKSELNYVPYLRCISEAMGSEFNKTLDAWFRRRPLSRIQNDWLISKQREVDHFWREQLQVNSHHTLYACNLFQCHIEHGGIRVDKVLSEKNLIKRLFDHLTNHFVDDKVKLYRANNQLFMSAEVKSPENWPSIVDIIDSNLFLTATLDAQSLALHSILNEAQMMLTQINDSTEQSIGLWAEPIPGWLLFNSESEFCVTSGIQYWLQKDWVNLQRWSEELINTIKHDINHASGGVSMISEGLSLTQRPIQQWMYKKGWLNV